MAILIEKRKTNILSVYDKPFKYGGKTVYGGQSSVITNIRTIEQDRNSVGISGDNGTQRTPGQEIFSYEIFFRVDMRTAIELGIDSLDFSLLSSPVRARLGNFVPVEVQEGTPRRVIEGLFRGNKEALRLSKVEKLSKLIGEGTIDLNKYINQAKIRDSQSCGYRLSDEQMFGRIKSITLEKIDKKKTEKEKKNFAFQPQHFSITRTNRGKETPVDFKDEYTRMIKMGIDPASIFFPDPAFVKSNCFPVRTIDSQYPAIISREKVDRIREEFSSANGGKPEITGNVESANISGKVVAQETFVVDRYKVVKLSFDILESSLANLSSFLCEIKVKNPENGMTVEKLEISVPHAVHVENYYIPDFLPKISLFRHDKGINDVAIDVSFCHIQDQKVKSVDARFRKINDDAPLIHSAYSGRERTLENSETTSVKSQPGYRLRSVSDISTTQMIIGRPFVTTQTDLRISNIRNSSAQKGENFNYLYSGIDIDNSHDGFFVNYFVDSPDASGVVVYRRMSNEVMYTPINHTLESSIGREENTVPLSVGDSISQACGSGRGSAFQDRIGNSLNREKVFHYKSKIFLKSGGYFWDKKVATAKRQKSLGVINVKTSDLSTPLDESSSSGNRQGQTVSFKISAEFKTSNTDILLDILREENKAEIFQDVIQSVRTSLSDIVVFGVTRTNLTTSEVDFIGYFKEGEFIDDGSSIGKELRLGSRYKYTVYSYLVSPEMIEKYFNLSTNYNKRVISKTKQVRMPSFIQKIQNVAVRDTAPNVGKNAVSTGNVGSFENLKIQKYYSGKEMQAGSIRSNQDYEQDYDFENFSTGDYTNVHVDLTAVSVRVDSDPVQSVSRSYSGCPVLRFSVGGNTEMLDFLVVTCIKNGIEKIAGTCMPARDGGVVFVDYTSSDFIGQVEYYTTPIFLNGVVGDRELVGNSILLQTQPSNIRNTSSTGGY